MAAARKPKPNVTQEQIDAWVHSQHPDKKVGSPDFLAIVQGILTLLQAGGPLASLIAALIAAFHPQPQPAPVPPAPPDA